MAKANQKNKNKQQVNEQRELCWSDLAWEDYLSWQKEDLAIVEKINDLIAEARRNPFQGKGKPEPLVGNLKGFWSRRITGNHRLVYMPDGNKLHIAMCKFHYHEK